MAAILIEPTRITPFVQLDSEAGVIEFKGRSAPEASLKFFLPIMESIYEDFLGKCPKVQVSFSFEYFNTSSSKCLYDILKQIQSLQNTGSEVTINWFYEDMDDDMRETGEDYEEALGLAFNYFPVENTDCVS